MSADTRQQAPTICDDIYHADTRKVRAKVHGHQRADQASRAGVGARSKAASELPESCLVGPDRAMVTSLMLRFVTRRLTRKWAECLIGGGGVAMAIGTGREAGQARIRCIDWLAV